jgi:hypothetical protein
VTRSVVLCVCDHCGRFWVEMTQPGSDHLPVRCKCGERDARWVYMRAAKAKACAKAALEFLGGGR